MLLRARLQLTHSGRGCIRCGNSLAASCASAAQICNSRAGMQRGHPQLVAGEDHNVLNVSVLDVLQHAA